MIVELLSLFTALCYGASSILARKGMRDSNPMTGIVVGSLVQVILLGALVLPIASAIFYGASSVTRKAALNILPESAFGAVVGAMASLTVFSVYLLVSRRTGELQVNWGGAAGSGWSTGWW